MNLVKWFRKNNKKLMAVVVIVIMFGFVGGAALERLFQGRGPGLHKTAAYFADNNRITSNDLMAARQELEILRMLRADIMLKSTPEPMFRVPDLRALLLGELLFSERATSPAIIGYVKQIVRTNDYSISSKQINDIYRRPLPSHVYWFLLKSEAERAGVRMSNESAGKELARIIPQLFNRAPYSQLIGSIISRQGIPEDQILSAFGKLLAVLEYTRAVCSGEDVTAQQIKHKTSWRGETIDVEFVRFDSSVFAESQAEPTEQEISAHFAKYKNFFAGAVSEQNPYGLGYRLADRVRLEYLVLELDDVSKIVEPPTQEEAEGYYQKHADEFAEQVPDPNDPNSLQARTKSYAEVAGDILELLTQNKKSSKAEQILQEAKTLTESAFEQAEVEPASLSSEQFREMVGDYETAAEELTKKYNVKLTDGQTGLLTAADMQTDEQLGRLYVRGYANNPVGLIQVVFAVDELQASELGPFDAPKPRLYENIGPVRDIVETIAAVVRVTEAEKASEPESMDQTLDATTLKLKRTEEQAGTDDPNHGTGYSEKRDIHSVKEKVAEDLRQLAAMDTARSKAEEFKDLAVKDGWEKAVDKFNELYGKAEANEADPNAAGQQETDKVQKPFKLQSLTNLPRIPSGQLGTLAVQQTGNPVGQLAINMAKREGKLRGLLYSLVPQDSNTVQAPSVLEFKPDMSYYCLKNISVRRLSQDEYEITKVMQAYREEVVQAQSLAAVYFNPDNISKRMRFRQVDAEERATEPNSSPARAGEP